MIKEIFNNLADRKHAVSAADLPALSAEEDKILSALEKRVDRVFGRSLRIRQVVAGSCNACEWKCTALTSPIYEIQRFGIDFVASPRDANILSGLLSLIETISKR